MDKKKINKLDRDGNSEVRFYSV